jgi:hypothetical protein
MDPVEAARQAALYERRPEFVALMQPHPMKKVWQMGQEAYFAICAGHPQPLTLPPALVPLYRRCGS